MGYTKSRGFMKDMNRADLLSMREGGMGNAAIAKALGCSTETVYALIGRQPEEITKRNRQEAIKRAQEAKTSEGGRAVNRLVKALSYTPKCDEAKAVLVMKPIQIAIPLHGCFMDYTISADRTMIDVDSAEGRTLMQIPAEMLDTFIAELTAIKNNIGGDGMNHFWG